MLKFCSNYLLSQCGRGVSSSNLPFSGRCIEKVRELIVSEFIRLLATLPEFILSKTEGVATTDRIYVMHYFILMKFKQALLKI